jgi:hypothetical protein
MPSASPRWIAIAPVPVAAHLDLCVLHRNAAPFGKAVIPASTAIVRMRLDVDQLKSTRSDAQPAAPM